VASKDQSRNQAFLGPRGSVPLRIGDFPTQPAPNPETTTGLDPTCRKFCLPAGRAAVIVPDGVLFGSSNAHKTLRKILVEEQKLDAVISLPGGVFKPYAGVSTAILLFTKTNSGGTDHVWFYDVDADGMSLDDKRTELLPPEKLGPAPCLALSVEEHAKNNLPDVLARWSEREGSEVDRPRTAQSFRIPKSEIQNQGYDLSLNRYKEVVHEEVAYRPPSEILKALSELGAEIHEGMKELVGMLQ
jgi:type I restriction enzyme M protein